MILTRIFILHILFSEERAMLPKPEQLQANIDAVTLLAIQYQDWFL